MTLLMLDTSAYAAFMRGREEAIVAVRRAETILLPAITLGELLAGFAVGTRATKNHRELDEFLSSPRVRPVSVGSETAARYAAIYAFLRKEGRPIPTNDLWIAAAAMEHGATLLTADDHFNHLPQILVHFL